MGKLAPDFGIVQILIILAIVVGYFVVTKGKGKWRF